MKPSSLGTPPPSPKGGVRKPPPSPKGSVRKPPPSPKTFEQRLAEIRERNELADQNHWLWLSHHWPPEHSQRCVNIAQRPVCRRCAVLHPLALVVAVAFALDFRLWPASFDPASIWVLSIPATVAFVGEAVGLWRYSVRWQVGTTLVAGLAFGRALSFELVDRWNPYFWAPLAVFAGIWFAASAYGHWRSHMVARSQTGDHLGELM